MAELIGVRLPSERRVRYVDAGEVDVSLLDWVVVETERGEERAQVVIAPEQVVYSEARGPFGVALRRADPE